MTFTQIQTEIRTRLDEASVIFWADADIREAINDGYQEMSDASEWYERNANINLTINTVYYDLTSSSILTDEFLAMKQAFNNQENWWLDPRTVWDLDASYRGWESVTGPPKRFFMRGLWFLGLDPKPPATSGTVRLYYSAMPAALSAGGDVPGFPQEFHFGLVEYALYDLLGQEAETQKALQHWKQYKGYEAALVDFVNHRISTPRLSGYKGA